MHMLYGWSERRSFGGDAHGIYLCINQKIRHLTLHNLLALSNSELH